MAFHSGLHAATPYPGPHADGDYSITLNPGADAVGQISSAGLRGAMDYVNLIQHSIGQEPRGTCDSNSSRNSGFRGGLTGTPGSHLIGSSSNSSSLLDSSGSSSTRRSRRGGEAGGPVKTKFNRKWQLLWCQEHCLKLFAEHRRIRLQDCANAYGADLACVKQVGKIFEHFQRMTRLRPPANFHYFAIVTVWREAKPLIRVFEKLREARLKGTLHELNNFEGFEPGFAELLPVFVVIFCANDVQHAKAVRWVESKTDFPVQIYCLIGCHEEPPEDGQGFNDLAGLPTLLEAASRGRTCMPDTALYNIITVEPEREVIDVHRLDQEHLREALHVGAYLRL